MLYHFSLTPLCTNFLMPSSNSHVKTNHKLILMSPTEDAFCVRLRSCLSCEAYCVCIACCMLGVGCAKRDWGTRVKVLMDGLKESLNQDLGEAWRTACLGLSPSSVTEHTQTSLCHLWVGVCLNFDCLNCKPTRPVKDRTNKRKPNCPPPSVKSLGCFWFIGSSSGLCCFHCEPPNL